MGALFFTKSLIPNLAALSVLLTEVQFETWAEVSSWGEVLFLA